MKICQTLLNKTNFSENDCPTLMSFAKNLELERPDNLKKEKNRQYEYWTIGYLEC